MKDVMRQPSVEQLQEQAFNEQKARRQKAQQLVETWAKVPSIGEGLKESYAIAPKKIENTAVMLNNTANEMAKLSEAMTSVAFNGLTPENALRVIRLAYPNSNLGEAFHEFAMQTAEDGMWYLSPVYASSKRGATANSVTHESDTERYASLDEEQSAGETPNGSVVAFTATLANAPMKPFFVRVLLTDASGNTTIVAQDNGDGVLVGPSLNAGATNTVNYTTGAITVTFTTAPATGSEVVFKYIYDYEDPAQYEDLGEIELRLRKVNFKLRSFRLGLSWSTQSELTLGSTLDIDAEESLVAGAADELIKARDYDAFKLGYREATKTSGANPREFDADHLSAGTDNPKDHAQSMKRMLLDIRSDIQKDLNRGGISSIVVGSYVANYIQTYLDGFSSAGADQNEIGIYKIGTLDGKPVFSVPNESVVPGNEGYTVWNNANGGSGVDPAIAFATMIPMMNTQVLQFKNFNKETGLASFGDRKTLQPKYLRRFKVNNLDRY